jgi:N6-L-threonylcarbamoyladenine synthase
LIPLYSVTNLTQIERAVCLLAIESSCDETSASVLVNGKIQSNCIASQKEHAEYGGVIPEMASRAHMRNIVPIVDEALKNAGIKKEQLNAIAFTSGPGLIGSLLVGASFAKAMALALNIPLITVNHMQAHILAHFIDDPKPNFPFLCLTVSGGHTQIVWVEDFFKMKIVGQTLDDAAGEAFDKTATLLGLTYPGGPAMDELAKSGNPFRFVFPEPKIPDLNFSFSGLKTAILYFLQKEKNKNPDFIQQNLNDLCASVQHSIVIILINKLLKAAKQFQCSEMAIAGGVSANSYLRKKLTEEAVKNNWNIYIPKIEYCTDNAAMIAMAAYYKFLANDFAPQSASPSARMYF